MFADGRRVSSGGTDKPAAGRRARFIWPGAAYFLPSIAASFVGGTAA
ncbi:MAG: hypothetical protein LBD86_02010 [Spirochaetaceae bacterium]|nr:hypothetical protein [Spirochaetaceae bacterium]